MSAQHGNETRRLGIGEGLIMVDLKAWRQSAGITQAKAADRLAITLRHYQKLEAGHAPINRRLALILELDHRAPHIGKGE